MNTADLEQAVIATLLVSPSLLADVDLPPDAFTVRENRVVFEEISRLVALYAEKTERLDVCAQAVLRLGLSESPVAFFERVAHPFAEHVESSLGAKVDVLARELRRRQLRGFASEFIASLDKDQDPAAALSAHQGQCERVVGMPEVGTMGQHVDRYLADQQRGDDSATKLKAALAIGFPSLSHIRFEPGKFIVFAGRPGSMKTTLALQIAAQVASRGFGVVYHGLEPTADELRDRLLSRMARVPAAAVASPSREERSAVDDAAARAGALPLVTQHSSKLRHVCLVTKRLVEHSPIGAPFRLAVVDYLQLVDNRRQKDRRERSEMLTEVSSTMVRMARALGITVLGIASMNREPDKDSRLPRMSDIRETGAFESDADVVMLLHRDAEKSPGDLVAIVDKNRQGRTGKIPLKADAEHYEVIDPKTGEQTQWGAAQ